MFNDDSSVVTLSPNSSSFWFISNQPMFKWVHDEESPSLPYENVHITDQESLCNNFKIVYVCVCVCIKILCPIGSTPQKNLNVSNTVEGTMNMCHYLSEN